MAEERIQLVPSNTLTAVPVPYVINFDGLQRQAAGTKYRLGHNAFSGPVAHKVAVERQDAEPRLRRELEVARFLGPRGGELLSKCLGYNFDNGTSWTVVTYRGQPLAKFVHDASNWPLAHPLRTKIITDLLQGVELLRVSRIVHGSINLNTVHWDGTTLQIVDFGQAALRGTYPDGRPAHHGDDILGAGRIIYQVHTGQPPPEDPVALREQIEQVQDVELRDLLLRRDLVTDTDRDYVFAPAPDRRPTARALLDRLDRRPHGVQWQQLMAKENAIREEFRRLRVRQQRFRDLYLPWAAGQARAATAQPRPAAFETPPGERPLMITPPANKPVLVLGLAVFAVIATLLLLLVVP